MVIRHATPAERKEWAKHPGVWINLQAAEVFVAEEDGEAIGFLCMTPLYLVDHLIPLRGNKITKSRAALLLYRAAEQFVRNPLTNRLGIRQTIQFTRREAVKGWADRLGWTRCYKRAATFTKVF